MNDMITKFTRCSDCVFHDSTENICELLGVVAETTDGCTFGVTDSDIEEEIT
ncbi:hypothetical protein P4631_09015 [Halalkalibacterium halodurans]|uniref:hypothetical protein n=1 Tax=Halalkalibacterium halodurans TaxID=86665 RepID=UPI002E24E458|nr:hypothetical protein [Halalkalibacterium halodurans]